jgi:hypothetical protein
MAGVGLVKGPSPGRTGRVRRAEIRHSSVIAAYAQFRPLPAVRRAAFAVHLQTGVDSCARGMQILIFIPDRWEGARSGSVSLQRRISTIAWIIWAIRRWFPVLDRVAR